VSHYVNALKRSGVRATATHISTDVDLSAVTDTEFRAALKRRKSAEPRARRLRLLRQRGVPIATRSRGPERRVPVQLRRGAAASRDVEPAVAAEHRAGGGDHRPASGLKFMCFLSSAHANQSLCTLCRELPNLSLAGYWWHNFFPSTIAG